VASRAVNVHVHKARNDREAGRFKSAHGPGNWNIAAAANGGNLPAINQYDSVSDFFVRRERPVGENGLHAHGKLLLTSFEVRPCAMMIRNLARLRLK
jgi:hypothetical protein